MATPRVLILRSPGTNCDQETAFAFEQAGAKTDLTHINRLLEDPALPANYQILCVSGGFSYGDDIAAGRILGNQFRHHLRDALAEFKASGKLILGICNGFQVLMKSGVLLADDPTDGPQATLAWNDSGKFEARWVRLKRVNDQCVFLQGVEELYLPVAHAEGRFVARNKATLERLQSNGQIVLQYTHESGIANGQVPYPANPNGSQANVAGMCDESGRVFGLMPHPERHIDPTNHPQWTRGNAKKKGDGMLVFENAVNYFSS